MSSSPKWIEGITPECSVEDAARRSLEPRLSAVVQYLPLAAYLASHDIEHVHRLRVATRRATAALKLYRDCLPPKKFRWMSRWLRTIRRAAGDARDLDVFTDRLAREYGERAAPVVDLVARDRAAVQPAIVQVADRCRKNDRLVKKVASLLHAIRLPRIVGDDERQLFGPWAADQFATVAGEFVLAMPDESSDTVALHDFRIRGKALRYAIELVASAFNRELRKELYPLVEDLQERLGRIQDHVAAAERCRNWADQTTDEAVQETLRELAEAESLGLVEAISDFRAWWTAEQVENVQRLLKPTPTVTLVSEATPETQLAD